MEEAVARLSLHAKEELREDDFAESDEECEDVELGFVQPPEQPWILERQHFPSKAGGAPAWLDPLNLPSASDACCGICEEPLQFLLQVYAPKLGLRDDAFHRTLYVFICTKMSCLMRDEVEQGNGSAHRSVKVFRSQLPRRNDFYSYEPPKSEMDRPLREGVDLCSWCATWRGDKTCGGCKRMRYCSRKHQVEHWRHGHSLACKSPEPSSTHSDHRVWKEFEIRIEEQEIDDVSTAEENPLQLATTGTDAITAELQEFEEPTKEKQHWAHFQALIARAPSQVLRYCSMPLWTKLDVQPEEASIQPCPHCGAPRLFEFQVLPQLLYYFGVENETHSLDWGTIAVYTCSEACSIEGYAQEFPWVQLWNLDFGQTTQSTQNANLLCFERNCKTVSTI